jgi:hypothetical protein
VGVLLAGINATEVGSAAAVLAVMVAVYQIQKTTSQQKRLEKRIVAGKDKTAQEETAAGVAKLVSVTFDRPISDTEPEGHRGLVTLVHQHGVVLARMEHDQTVSGATMDRVEREVTPNGGNTDHLGDMQLKQTREMRLTEAQRRERDGLT